MNISGIPWLQTAAGCSIGEVVDPAKGHQSRTLQEASLSSHWPTSRAKLEQRWRYGAHIKARIQDIGRRGRRLT